jgi:peptidoglycan/xylan/chitin deacetylase (PgdA/CDA1 family)
MASPLLALAPVVPAVADRYGLPRRCTASGAVALTFDDGPHPEGTPRVLEILAEHDVKATFFLVGEQVERRPALAAEIAAAGHVVALHAHRHRCQLRLTRRQLAEDLERGAQAVASATGAEPELHRPPYGIYSAEGLKLARSRYTPILWSRWGKDWRRLTTPARIAARAGNRLAPGDVILLHDADFYSSRDSWRRTVEALPCILRSASMDRLSIVPLRRDELG